MKMLLRTLWIVCGAGLLFHLDAQSLEPATADLPSCEDTPDRVASDRGFESIVNPVVPDLNRARATLEEFRRMRQCLRAGSVSSVRVRQAATYLDLYITFFDSAEAVGPIDLVDLSESDDPGIVRLRDEVGLEPPIGPVFVRYFRDADQMPALFRRAFENPQTRAVTIGTRYVAILAPSARSLAESRLLDDALEATFSHELIHAFLNARLGSMIFDHRFPGWFHEGVAIYFSGSGRGHVAVDHAAGSVWTIEPTVEYERYERAFLFGESHLGPEAFHLAIRDAVNAADASVLLRRLGFDSFEALSGRAERWWRWRPIPISWLDAPRVWGVLIVAGIAGLSAWRIFRRWEPVVPGSALEIGVHADLFEAVKSARDDDVRYLLRSGAEPNVVDGEGWSALRWAVFFNRAAAVEALLAAGADPTPELLGFAESRDAEPAIVRLLADALAAPDDGEF